MLAPLSFLVVFLTTTPTTRLEDSGEATPTVAAKQQPDRDAAPLGPVDVHWRFDWNLADALDVDGWQVLHGEAKALPLGARCARSARCSCRPSTRARWSAGRQIPPGPTALSSSSAPDW